MKPEQIKLFQQRAIAFHSALDIERQEVGRLKKSLFGLMRADDFDHKAIDAAIVRINGRQHDMQKMVVTHMIEFKGMLAKDQQRKFFDLIEQAMTKRGEMQCQ